MSAAQKGRVPHTKEHDMTTNTTSRRIVAATLLAAAGAVSAFGLSAGTADAAPGKYAAIAYSPESNAWGYWSGSSNFQTANYGSLNECVDHGGNHCVLVAWSKGGCVALAVDPTDQNHYAAAPGPTQISAMTNALNNNGGGRIVQVT